MIYKYLVLFLKLHVISSKSITYEAYEKGQSNIFSEKSDSDRNKENYFPDVIYPTSILDVAQPFFYGVDELTSPFSEDVKSLYNNLKSNPKQSKDILLPKRVDKESRNNALRDNIAIVTPSNKNYSEDKIKILTSSGQPRNKLLEKYVTNSTNISSLNNKYNETPSQYDSGTSKNISIPFDILHDINGTEVTRYNASGEELKDKNPVYVKVNIEVYKIIPDLPNIDKVENIYKNSVPDQILTEHNSSLSNEKNNGSVEKIIATTETQDTKFNLMDFNYLFSSEIENNETNELTLMTSPSLNITENYYDNLDSSDTKIDANSENLDYITTDTPTYDDNSREEQNGDDFFLDFILSLDSPNSTVSPYIASDSSKQKLMILSSNESQSEEDSDSMSCSDSNSSASSYYYYYY